MSVINKELPPPSGNISQCLKQMISDAREIKLRLACAPLSLIGENEPKLHQIMEEISRKLDEAENAWPD